MHSNLVKHKTIIAACHFTGVHDVNRNTVLLANDYSYVKKWADSITALGLTGILFHNHFSEHTCNLYQTVNIIFINMVVQFSECSSYSHDGRRCFL